MIGSLSLIPDESQCELSASVEITRSTGTPEADLDQCQASLAAVPTNCNSITYPDQTSIQTNLVKTVTPVESTIAINFSADSDLGSAVTLSGNIAIAEINDPPLVAYPIPQSLTSESVFMQGRQILPDTSDACSVCTGNHAMIATGDGHSCALLSGGAVKCWGDNRWGQVGIPIGSSPDTCNTSDPCADTQQDV